MPGTRKTFSIIAAAALFFVLFACGAPALHAQTVVASTSLTGALARAAGASEVTDTHARGRDASP